MKRPSFQFYPGDWLRATELRVCSVGARGLWIDMICLMHEGKPYGHLKVGDKVILPANLALMVGANLEVVQGWLEELKAAGVYSVDESGCIYSRRMVRDEYIRKIRAEGGKLGGNPALMKGGGRLNKKVKQKPTPAFASASASAVSTTEANASVVPSDGGGGSEKPQLPQSQPKRVRARGVSSNGSAAWDSYASAYFDRYGSEPVRNAKTNALIAQVVARIGEAEAPHVAAFFVRSNRGLYVSATHALDLLARDCEALRTQWARGLATTETEARQADRTAATGNTFASLKQEVRKNGTNG